MKAADDIKKINKDYEAKIATQGCEYGEVERLPSGVLAFDLATGGGFPVGRTAILFGPASSGKTTQAILAARESQRLYPKKKVVYVDVEGTFDREFAVALGLDVDKIVYVLPDFGEQVVDIIDQLMYAEDVGLIILDSLAAMITTAEVEKSAEKGSMGGSGLIVGKLYRKVTRASNYMRSHGGVPASLILINQIRMAIGVMFGNPEVMPGGLAWQFGSSMTVRMYGKDVGKAKHGDEDAPEVVLPQRHVSGVIKKNKVPILAKSFEYDMDMVVNKESGAYPGRTSEWKTFAAYAEQHGLLMKDDKKWLLFAFGKDGDFMEFKTRDECQQHYENGSGYRPLANAGLIRHLRKLADAPDQGAV